MKKQATIFLLFLTVAVSVAGASYAGPKVVYTSPLHQAELVNAEENILIRFDSDARNILDGSEISVQGSMSGAIPSSAKILEEGKLLLLDPSIDFGRGEVVSVMLTNKFSKETLHAFEFTADENPMSEEEKMKTLLKIRKAEFGNDFGNEEHSARGYPHLPATEPQITIHVNSNPSPGTIFFGNFPQNPYLVAMKPSGQFLYAGQMPSPCYDFRLQETGLLTFFRNQGQMYFGMDSSYNITDSFYTVNGYETDLHELIVLPNGNYIIMSYDVKEINMSKIVPGGQKNAQVTGLIIQEIDPSRNAVFQWRSWDHFEITDADSVDLSLGVIDYCHGNAIEIDYDGNLLLSSRNMSEVTKINRTTGEKIWRLGGKNNQFTFLNDSIKFSYQHAIRRTAAGTFTLFDNGNFHNPKVSRAVEYSINESARTCTRIWEYRNDPPIYSFAMGYVERLPNGNTSISWGFSNITYTEVTPSGQKAYEFSLENLIYSYRVVKEDWNVKPLSISESAEEFGLIYNYPNPFNGSTVIRYSVKSRSVVNLKVYDMLGREVIQLVSNESKLPGNYSVPFSSNELTSGLYFYVLESEGMTRTGKMMLLK